MKEYREQDVKKYIVKTFGFAANKIKLIEWGNDPLEYCVFRVCDIYNCVDRYTYVD